ncbi:MAG: Gfo/Idh/MocA family oxidoreductase [Armatimonadetes bacterium]|nr:Gfo/Idh/MocA family oxidoreductase [Armatimonadota bacterium]
MALGWAISGVSDIATKALAPAVLAQPDAELVAVYSRSARRGGEFAQRFGSSAVYTDFGAMLSDPAVDIVYVGGEVDRHRPETIAAAEAGRHVLCEKPMALDAAECRAMIDACAANGVHLAIAYYRRYYPSVRKLTELVQAGALGQVLQAAIDMSYYRRPLGERDWRTQPAGGGGALMDIGSHRLDVLCGLLGEPRRVAGFTAHRVHEHWAPDVETLIVEFACGAQATLRCNWCAGASQDLFTVVGTEAVALLGALEEPSFILRRRGQPDEMVQAGAPAAITHGPLVDDLTQRLLAGQPPRFDGLAGYQASRIMDGCYRSAATGSLIELGET